MAIHSRLNRISDGIQEIIVVLLRTKVRDPRLKWVSITSVEISKDLHYARVFFSSLDLKIEISDILKAFEAATGFFRTQMAKQLHLRTVPMLRFFYDDSLAYGDKMNQLMEAGALGVQITISGKLRGDRSAFEKHVQGVLPRAGNYAKNVVSEDIVHTKTKMGLIGIKIRIANKEKIVPEFKLEETIKPEIKETEEVKQKSIAKTESEQIKIEEEKMKSLETLEEEEQRLK